MTAFPHVDAVRKDITKTDEILANDADRHCVTVYNGHLVIGGCDCYAPVADVDTARRIVDVITRWINAPEVP